VLAGEHLGEGLRELLISIANEEAEHVGAIGQAPRELSHLLRHPVLSRMRRAAGDVNVTAAEFDEEDHVQPLEPDGLPSGPLRGVSGHAVDGPVGATDTSSAW